ncbi:MAG: cytochrome oxidase subunit III [Nitratireductor sp.]|nr:cytochrome oxidase subunit III [Nitratireductor sp.]
MTERFFVKLGWWLFVVSACLFIWAGWRAGDWISLAGGLAFLGANISFMIPVYRTLK